MSYLCLLCGCVLIVYVRILVMLVPTHILAPHFLLGTTLASTLPLNHPPSRVIGTGREYAFVEDESGYPAAFSADGRYAGYSRPGFLKTPTSASAENRKISTRVMADSFSGPFEPVMAG